MTEQHEIYRVSSQDIGGLLNELNRILNLLSDRLDKIEGHRGTPAFYTSEFDYPGQSISGFLKAGTQSADFNSINTSDLVFSTLELGDDYIKIFDSNGEVIHQLGDG